MDVLNIWYDKDEYHKIMVQNDLPGTPYCTGLMCIKSDHDTIYLLEEAIKTNNKEIEAGNLHWGDQMSFIKAVADHPLLCKSTKCADFPGELFPNGHRLKNNQYDKENFVLAHANYVVGMNDKIKLLKSCGCWIENAEEIISR